MYWSINEFLKCALGPECGALRNAPYQAAAVEMLLLIVWIWIKMLMLSEECLLLQSSLLFYNYLLLAGLLMLLDGFRQLCFN
ncbi:hypothetical protein Nepgr_018779 [Nepenthes gracilis]|uniref:Uncharacterized protein n=1 Tax=Nepenthes gracilis TaxID=150966 RepID=A0AAD3SRZ1_NEPGR|nr:hypothetical protein Nepgr_018779 [Nepenthes gracilis]